jgi:SET domain-containing protein
MDMLEEVIKHLSNNIKTKIGVSSTNGIGVFAIRDIMEGDDVFIPWKFESGMYIIPNNRLDDIPKEVAELMDMYFINEECGYKVIRLFKGFNFLFHGTSFCNSAFPNEENVNISTKGIALRDIKAGEEILEWYTQNIDLANSK